MKLTEKETKVLMGALKVRKNGLIEYNKKVRSARDIILGSSLDAEIEDTTFSLNTLDRIINSMEKGEELEYHNQTK